MGRLIRVYPESDMRCAHEGLTKIAKREGQNLKNIKQGEFIVFINSRWTIAKIFCSDFVVVHIKNPEGGRIEPRALRYLPSIFDGRRFDYPAAVRKVIEEELGEQHELREAS